METGAWSWLCRPAALPQPFLQLYPMNRNSPLKSANWKETVSPTSLIKKILKCRKLSGNRASFLSHMLLMNSVLSNNSCTISLKVQVEGHGQENTSRGSDDSCFVLMVALMSEKLWWVSKALENNSGYSGPLNLLNAYSYECHGNGT